MSVSSGCIEADRLTCSIGNLDCGLGKEPLATAIRTMSRKKHGLAGHPIGICRMLGDQLTCRRLDKSTRRRGDGSQVHI